MPTPPAAHSLADYERQYRDLLAQLSDLGFITAGSLASRYNRCGKPTCHCRAEPPQLHGPYWQWTAKIDGKTVTRRLTPADAQRYQQWIANDRQLRALIDQMRQVAAKATEMILEEDRNSSAEV